MYIFQMKMTYLRIVLAAFAFLATVLGLPWAVLISMVLLALRFRAWEVLIIGVVMDFLWLPSESLIWPLPLFTIGALLLVWGLEPLRNEMLV